MKRTIFMAYSVALALSACVTLRPTDQLPTNGPVARIRLNTIPTEGPTIKMSPATACIPKGAKSDAFMPYEAPPVQGFGFGLAKRETRHIGIPNTKETGERNNEYYVESGKPALMAVSFFSQSGGDVGFGKSIPVFTTKCGPSYFMFIPGEGKDYEISGIVTKGGSTKAKYCVADVKEIVEDGSGNLTTKPVFVLPALSCRG